MRVSEYYNLQRNQSELDFVDVDTTDDIPVYIDPSNIRRLTDTWGEECTLLLGTFFSSVLNAVRVDDGPQITALLSNLSEPNETHLGLSAGKSRGRGLGRFLRKELAAKLATSKAAQSGLIEDLEDTALFIDRVDKDIVSDVATNVIRGALIAYTQSVCDFYGIPVEQVYSGPVWDAVKCEWEEGFTELPVADGEKLLLVPKAIVRRSLYLSRGDYYKNHLLPVLQDEELDNPKSRLVRTLKSGKKYVTKKDVEAFYGNSKPVVAKLTVERPNVYVNYKHTKRSAQPGPMSHEDLGEATQTNGPDFDELLQKVLDTPVGTEHATQYHHNVEALLTAIFYPSLTMPVKEHKLHEGRKRVDIRYTNSSVTGFFQWLKSHHVPCKYVFIECKNYGKEVGNPEIDQISSRFSQLRGQVGIFTCRSFAKKDVFLKRCRDTALDHRGYVIALDDDDLGQLVEDVKLSLLPPPEDVEEDAPPRLKTSDYPLLYERLSGLID
ncbi:hypothetical protein ACFY1A_22630 [Streptomyces sp. NPDC001520]|uniref:hypothetical protein n=1 Tax=Streptomyces sp. NPDC001520 TaxID=3364581 RepID=UPI00369C45BB